MVRKLIRVDARQIRIDGTSGFHQRFAAPKVKKGARGLLAVYAGARLFYDAGLQQLEVISSGQGLHCCKHSLISHVKPSNGITVDLKINALEFAIKRARASQAGGNGTSGDGMDVSFEVLERAVEKIENNATLHIDNEVLIDTCTKFEKRLA